MFKRYSSWFQSDSAVSPMLFITPDTLRKDRFPFSFWKHSSRGCVTGLYFNLLTASCKSHPHSDRHTSAIHLNHSRLLLCSFQYTCSNFLSLNSFTAKALTLPPLKTVTLTRCLSASWQFKSKSINHISSDYVPCAVNVPRFKSLGFMRT